MVLFVLLVFLVESEKAHEGAILLLDEPGLHLHPTLQTKLIDLLSEYRANNQLLYSTTYLSSLTAITLNA